MRSSENFGAREMLAIRMEFNAADTNGSGAIDSQELGKIVNSLSNGAATRKDKFAYARN